MRVEAASELFKKHKGEVSIIASGGKGQLRNNPEAPTIASVIQSELVSLGVPKAAVKCEENSNNTYEQLKALENLLARESWPDITILTNQWQILRAQAFADTLQGLTDYTKEGKINFVAAEQVLIEADPEHWRVVIDTAYKSEEMKDRVKKEAEGVRAIKEGTYKFS